MAGKRRGDDEDEDAVLSGIKVKVGDGEDGEALAEAVQDARDVYYKTEFILREKLNGGLALGSGLTLMETCSREHFLKWPFYEFRLLLDLQRLAEERPRRPPEAGRPPDRRPRPLHGLEAARGSAQEDERKRSLSRRKMRLRGIGESVRFKCINYKCKKALSLRA